MTGKVTPIKKGKKPNIFTRLLVLIITSALVLGALTLVVYRDRFNIDAFKRFLTYRTMETTESGEAAPFTHAGGTDMSIAYVGNGLLTSSSTGARYYALNGKLYGEEVLPLENPVLSSSRSTGVVYNAGGQSLFIFEQGEGHSDLNLDEGTNLLCVRPNDSGWLAITAQQSGYKGTVTVYDGEHQPVIQISLSSTFVMDAILSPDCRTVAVVTINQEVASFYSRLILYSVNDTEPIARIDLGNFVPLDLDYERDHIWILGENQLMIVSRDGNEQVSYSFGQNFLKGCDLEGDGFALLLTGHYRAGSANQALIIDSQGQVAHTLDLSGQILDLSAAGNYCALLMGGQLNIYTRELKPYASLSNPQGAKQVDLAQDGSALLANGQKAWLYIPH